jgi:ribonuclease D
MERPVYVADDAGLRAMLARLCDEREIAIDTESNTLFAYREKLCLLQISVPGADFVVDPLAGIEIGRLAPLLADATVGKVLHDAEFDLLLLRRTFPFEVRGLFDTKVAAAALGLPAVGLAALLLEHHGVVLDKSHQRSDWGRRPLSAAQLDYARLDTRYLLPLAARLRAAVESAAPPCELEVLAECRRLESLEVPRREFDPEAFTAISGAERLDPGGYRALRELFVMRHEIADRADLPAFKVLGNDQLLALARERDPGVLPGKLAERYGEPVRAALLRARELGPLPRAAVAVDELEGLDPNQRRIYEALRAWRRRTSRRRQTDPSLVLPRTTMLQLARLLPYPRTPGELAVAGLLEPWRIEWYGEELVAAGRRAR